jgi:hypothetical protein
MSQSGVPIVEDVAREGSNLSSSITNSVTDDLLGFDPSGGGIYDVTRDVLGDEIADDVLGFDPGGGGIVPVTNTAADMAVKYAIGQAVGSTFGGESAATGAPIENAVFEPGVAGTAAESAAMNQALADLSAQAAADAAFVAADTAQLWDQTKSVAAVQQNLIYSGVDPLVAAEAANAAAMGLSGAALEKAIMDASQKGASSLYTATPSDVADFASGAIKEAPPAVNLQQASNALKLINALGEQAAVTPLLQPAQQQQTQPGVVDYSNYLSLLASQMPQRRTSLI